MFFTLIPGIQFLQLSWWQLFRCPKCPKSHQQRYGAYWQAPFSYTASENTARKCPRIPQPAGKKPPVFQKYILLLLPLFNLAGQEVTAQAGQSEIWRSQACSRPLCWHSSVIQQVNFWISKQAPFLRQSLCLRSHLAGVSHQETSLKALFPKTALETTRVLCGGS